MIKLNNARKEQKKSNQLNFTAVKLDFLDVWVCKWIK